MGHNQEIEAVLRFHPGVQDVAAINDGKRVKAFVVPNERYLEEVLGFGAAATAVSRKWQKIFDLTQFSRKAATAQVGFNFVGWNSYTRQPFPAEQIHEWMDSAAQEIVSLDPRVV